MEKFTEYQIATSESPNLLTIAVGRLMTAGWQPIGGVAIVAKPPEEIPGGLIKQGSYVLQAMGR